LFNIEVKPPFLVIASSLVVVKLPFLVTSQSVEPSYQVAASLAALPYPVGPSYQVTVPSLATKPCLVEPSS